MTTTTAAANKATLRRLNEVFNSGDWQRISTTIDDVFRPDVHIRTPLQLNATGTDLMRQLWSALLSAFPDLHVEVQDVIAEGDKVVSRNTVTGTHHGEYMGVAPTGKPITWNEIFICRLDDGRIAETWGVVDIAAQRRQLGLDPAGPA